MLKLLGKECISSCVKEAPRTTLFGGTGGGYLRDSRPFLHSTYLHCMEQLVTVMFLNEVESCEFSNQARPSRKVRKNRDACIVSSPTRVHSMPDGDKPPAGCLLCSRPELKLNLQQEPSLETNCIGACTDPACWRHELGSSPMLPQPTIILRLQGNKRSLN